MNPPISKARIDKAGTALANPPIPETMEYLELEEVFDLYRAKHLEPLTRTTAAIQTWLTGYGGSYYIAQRLKRKPQISRKLRRLSTRLTQLQDIGGLRIIVSNNAAVDELNSYLDAQIANSTQMRTLRTTDYREKGRDVTGYRALHKIMIRDGVTLEIQIRSRIQHYWAENIEKTSIIANTHLKESEGPREILEYFRALSDIFHDVENGRALQNLNKVEFESKRQSAEIKINELSSNRNFSGFIEEDVIKTLSSKEASSKNSLNNWLLVFNWSTGSFVSWDEVDRDPIIASEKYSNYEKIFKPEEGYEVVLIGSSDISTVRETHSHYFGITPPDNILENLDESLTGLSSKMDLGVGSRQILATMYRKRFWNTKSTSIETLKNHFCHNVAEFDESLESLISKGLVFTKPLGGISLDLKKKNLIESYL